MKESAVSAHIRLEAARLNTLLYRNNVGMAWMGEVYKLNDGSILIKNPRPVRYGLCNDSKKLNDVIKSSDLIGSTPTIVTPEMIGQTLGVITAVETKPHGWVYRETDKRALAQSKFHDIVKQAGGYAGFATCIEDFRRIIKK